MHHHATLLYHQQHLRHDKCGPALLLHHVNINLAIITVVVSAREKEYQHSSKIEKHSSTKALAVSPTEPTPSQRSTGHRGHVFI